MRLVVVYGLKTVDYGYFETFYPSRRLAEECANRSIPLRFLFPRDVPSFLSESVADGIKRDTICLIRGKVYPDTVRLLEMAGWRTVNTARALSLANDKIASARFLETNGWPTPETRFAGDIPRGPDSAIAFPVVAKPRFGSRGEGVRLVESVGELAGLESDTILQDYIETSRGRDLRFFFAGGAVLTAVLRQASGGGFISNANTGGTMRAAPHTAAELVPWNELTLEIARKAGLWYGSVDFLYCGQGTLDLTVCEINGSPGFEALETECKLDIAGALVDRLAAL